MSIYDLGFTEKHVAVLTKRYDKAAWNINFKQTEAILNRHEEGIGQLMEEVGFKPSNITSMLRDVGDQLDNTLRELTDHTTISAFKKLQTEVGFVAKNISAVLKGAGKHTAQSAKQLANNESIQTLTRFQGESDLKPETLSSLLSASGKHVKEAIATLGNSGVRQTFDDLGDIGLSPKNISSMVHNQAGRLDERLEVLTDKSSKLEIMVEILSADTVSSKIHKSKGKLGDKIDQLYDAMLEEITGQFSPLDAKTAETSPAVKHTQDKTR